MTEQDKSLQQTENAVKPSKFWVAPIDFIKFGLYATRTLTFEIIDDEGHQVDDFIAYLETAERTDLKQPLTLTGQMRLAQINLVNRDEAEAGCVATGVRFVSPVLEAHTPFNPEVIKSPVDGD